MSDDGFSASMVFQLGTFTQPETKRNGKTLTIHSSLSIIFFLYPDHINLWLFFFFSNCNTATLKSVVFNSIDSSALPQVSLFFNVPFIQINKQGKSGIFGSSIFTYCVECYINTIISRRMQSGFLFRLNNITLTQ